MLRIIGSAEDKRQLMQEIAAKTTLIENIEQFTGKTIRSLVKAIQSERVFLIEPAKLTDDQLLFIIRETLITYTPPLSNNEI